MRVSRVHQTEQDPRIEPYILKDRRIGGVDQVASNKGYSKWLEKQEFLTALIEDLNSLTENWT